MMKTTFTGGGPKLRAAVVLPAVGLAILLPLAAAACGGSGDGKKVVEKRTTVSTQPVQRPTRPVTAAEPEVELELVDVTPRAVSFAEAESTFTEGKYDEAVELFTLFSEEHPKNLWGHYMLGLSQWKSGEAESAERSFERALELNPEHQKSLINLARVLIEGGRPHQALVQVEKALELEPESNGGHRLMGRVRYALGEEDEAIASYQRALTIGDEDAWSMNNLALIYIRRERFEDGVTRWRTGDYEAAVAEQELALTLAREANDRKWEANALHALGSIAQFQGDFPKSAGYHRQALEIRREIGDRHGEARSLQSLGAIIPELGEGWEEVLQVQQEALEIFREVGDRRFECSMLGNVGCTFSEVNRFSEAIDYLEQAAEIGRELGDLVAEAYPLMNLGNTYAIVGRVRQAKTSFARALASFAEAGIRSGELATNEHLGRVLLTFGDYDAARRHLDAALTLAVETQAQAKEHRIEILLAKLLRRTNKRREAWERLDRALGLAERMDSARGRSVTLQAMGTAALEEEDYDRAADLLQKAVEAQNLEQPDARSLLLFCRLARAHTCAGRTDEAEQWAQKAEAFLDKQPDVSPEDGPEIFFTLKTVYDKDDRGLRYLDAARNLVATRTQTIRDPAFKEHYLTRVWPTREIVEEAKRLLDR